VWVSRVILAAQLLSGCGLLAAQTPVTLRAAGAPRGVLMGSAALATGGGTPDLLEVEPGYAETLAREYGMLEPENAMKWMGLHRMRDEYDFAAADRLVTFAAEHGMKVRGHTLCWGLSNPSWVEAYRNRSPEEVAALLHEHIRTVVTRYRGRVFAWDVVNEAFDNDAGGEGRIRDSVWYNRPGIGQEGTGFIEQAFRWARESDPDALLFYNENNILEENRKFSAVFRMMRDFLARGVPVGGVGLQVHLRTGGASQIEGLDRVVTRFTGLGLLVHFTEVDVAVPVDAAGAASSQDLKRQAAIYARLLKICLRHKGCTAFQTWGFTDRHSWIPSYLPGLGAALPFDQDNRPKPAYNAMLRVLQERKIHGILDSQGKVSPEQVRTH
jgi:endo-1,4-beta-xylanase